MLEKNNKTIYYLMREYNLNLSSAMVYIKNLYYNLMFSKLYNLDFYDFIFKNLIKVGNFND